MFTSMPRPAAIAAVLSLGCAQMAMAADKDPALDVATESMRFVPGKGLEVASADGAFKLQTRLRAQFLAETTAVADEPVDQQLMIRRARLQFGGNMWGKHNKFKVELAVAPRDMSNESVDFDGDDVADTTVVKTSPLLDWYHEFTQLRDLTFRMGQYKVPYSRQRVVSSGDMQLVDRSTTANAEFNLDRDIGMDFRSNDLFGLDALRYYAGVYIGEGRNTSDKTAGAGDLGLMYLARVEVLPLGDFDDYSEGDLDRSTSAGLSLGAAYAFLDNAPNDEGILGSAIPVGDVWRYHNATADAMFKVAGLSVMTEGFLRKGASEQGALTLDGWGWMAQSGFLLPTVDLEFVGRYGLSRPLGGPGETAYGTGLNEAGGGVNYYFAGHPLKLQGDVFQLWEEGASETVARVQLQAAL